MIEEIKKDTRARMSKSVESLKHAFSKLRTGRAQATLLDQVSVSYYGTDTPLNQVASVVVSDARTLTVTPWEKKIVPGVEKAILNSDLGLNPVTAGDVIRVPLPALTEERRKEMTRVVRHEAEDARVAIRNIRRDANHHLKGLIKEEHLAKDKEHRAEDEVQKLTDRFIATVDELLKAKEQDLMEF
jgi:ribosome recycling factor